MEPKVISRGDLKRSSPDYVKRLAKFLRLKVTDKMSHKQIANLVYWLLTRNSKQ